MLMEGITIMNQTEIMTVPEWIYSVGLLSMGFAAIALMIGLIFSSIYAVTKKSIMNILAIIALILTVICMITSIVFVGLYISKSMKTIPTGKYKYEVTVDDNITYKNYKEFCEKYEIIEEKEDSLIVKEKGES